MCILPQLKTNKQKQGLKLASRPGFGFISGRLGWPGGSPSCRVSGFGREESAGEVGTVAVLGTGASAPRGAGRPGGCSPCPSVRRWPTFSCSCEPAGEVGIASRSVLGCGPCVSLVCSFMGHLLGLLIRRGEVTALGKT